LYEGRLEQSKWLSYREVSPAKPADKEYCTRRITELELELQKLNVLDHALQIVRICKQIIKLKKQRSIRVD
jgi:hypothetical protein